ncbi:hypothetical protein EYF80_036026 [Liparis tanakae]|uniref:Uncharacterized protein n=1 Tax=Liparis tanakae TaxID=230148 RepID=A0A4Z2GKE0_9TELE|nr:hypothetical protein EYF80_036026 [Liparis tanakae]
MPIYRIFSGRGERIPRRRSIAAAAARQRAALAVPRAFGRPGEAAPQKVTRRRPSTAPAFEVASRLNDFSEDFSQKNKGHGNHLRETRPADVALGFTSHLYRRRVRRSGSSQPLRRGTQGRPISTKVAAHEVARSSSRFQLFG